MLGSLLGREDMVGDSDGFVEGSTEGTFEVEGDKLTLG